MHNLSFLFYRVSDFLKGFSAAFKTQSTEYIEFELRELENAFALLLMGSLIGLPAPPTPLTMRVMPYMAREIYVMQRRAKTDDAMGEIAALFDIG